MDGEVSFNSMGFPEQSPSLRLKRTDVACINCCKAKTKCDQNRPCGRCVRLQKDNCIDRPLKTMTSMYRGFIFGGIFFCLGLIFGGKIFMSKKHIFEKNVWGLFLAGKFLLRG